MATMAMAEVTDTVTVLDILKMNPSTGQGFKNGLAGWICVTVQLKRAKRKKVTRDILNAPTSAEIIVPIYKASLRSPVQNDLMYLYFKLFKKMFGRKYYDKITKWKVCESYKGASKEIENTIKKKLNIEREIKEEVLRK